MERAYLFWRVRIFLKFAYKIVTVVKKSGNFYKTLKVSSLELCPIWQLYISNEENYSQGTSEETREISHKLKKV